MALTLLAIEAAHDMDEHAGGYSKRSQELAHLLAAKVADNLRGSGKTVERDAETGRYRIVPEACDG